MEYIVAFFVLVILFKLAKRSRHRRRVRADIAAGVREGMKNSRINQPRVGHSRVCNAKTNYPINNTPSIIGSELDKVNQKKRDSETQNESCLYKIGQHGNEALALRYGIVNQKNGNVSYQIRLQKIEKLSTNKFKVKLIDFGNKEAIAIHELGTDYVKTFYPLNEAWFKEHDDLETALKNTGSFSLKELAKFHIDTLIAMKARSQ